MSDFKAKMYQIQFYSAPPDPLTGLREPTSKERGGERRGREKGNEGTKPHPFTRPLIDISGYIHAFCLLKKNFLE